MGIFVAVIASLVFLQLFRLQNLNTSATSPSVGESDTLIDRLDIDDPSPSEPSSTDATNLDHVLGFTSPFERTLVLDDFLSQLDSAALIEMITQSEGINTIALRNEVQQSVVRMLAVANPTRALDEVNHNFSDDYHNDMIQVVFEEWCTSNLAEAVANAKVLDEKARTAALTGILLSRADLSSSSRRAIARDLGIEQFVVQHIELLAIGEPVDNPKEAWKSLVLDYGTEFEHLTDLQREILVHVAKAWIGQQGVDALPRLADSVSSRSSRVWLVSEVLSQLSSSELEAAQEVSEEMIQSDYLGFVQILESWARSHGGDALDLAMAVDEEKGTMRMQRAVVRAWAESDPHAVLTQMANLPDSLQTWTLQTALLEMGKVNPEAVPELIDRIENLRSKEIVVNNLASNWSRQDPFAALRWVYSDPIVKQLPGSPEWTVLNAAVEVSSQRALDVALDLPANDFGVGPEATVISKIAERDLERALDMVKLARNSDTALNARLGIAQTLVEQGMSERAITLVEKQTKEYQISFFEHLAPRWAQIAPRDLFNRLDEMPSDKVRELCAAAILYHDRIVPFLSADDREELRELAPNSTHDSHEHTTD